MRTILKRDKLWDIVCPEEVALEWIYLLHMLLSCNPFKREETKRLGTSPYCKRQCDTLHRGIHKSGTSMENIDEVVRVT